MSTNINQYNGNFSPKQKLWEGFFPPQHTLPPPLGGGGGGRG